MHLCGKCSSYVGGAPPPPPSTASHRGSAARGSSGDPGPAAPSVLAGAGGAGEETPQPATNPPATCFVCLGFWQHPDELERRLTEAIESAVEPYRRQGGDGASSLPWSDGDFLFCGDPAVTNLPGDFVHRYRLACSSCGGGGDRGSRGSKPDHVFANDLKQHAKDAVKRCVSKLTADSSTETAERQHSSEQSQSDQSGGKYPSCVREEEQGYLSVYVVIVPSKGVARPTHLFPGGSNKRKRRRNHHHHQDTPTQGGDPKANFEQRLSREEGVEIWSINRALAVAPTSSANDGTNDVEWLVNVQEDTNKILVEQTVLDAGGRKESKPPLLVDAHVAVWRKPFYLRGTYTKSRRDVSQTPFYANSGDAKTANSKVDSGADGGSNTGRRKKLGVTSVEEEILNVVTKYCGGISTRNNDPTAGGATLFGMAKFHASGREDMDVRMLLPRPLTSDDAGSSSKAAGRPFVCEIIDACHMPKVSDLRRIAQDINHESDDSQLKEEKMRPSNGDDGARSYGNNPMGVGISPDDFRFVPASSFKNLQSETEGKVKYYGCLCWSSVAFASLEELQRRIAYGAAGGFPLTIHQRTPLRVLHRRSNAVRERRILSCRVVERIDPHYFRLHLSSDAGTYIKEFVSGDLGRTQPNLSTILSAGDGASWCKTDILELDCEGIAVF